MKTLIIYNSTTEVLQYTIVEGDYSDLNGICLNSFDEDTIKVEKACNLLLDKDGGFLLPFSEDISLLNNKNWDVAAVITFIL